jgi:hypothetical protein
MPRYFFRADYPGIGVSEFSTLQGAEDHATSVANELTQAVIVSVFSEDGILLAKAVAPF